MFSAVSYCGFAFQHFISIKNESQVGGGLARLCNMDRRLLSRIESLAHFISFSHSLPLFAASGGGQVFRDQQVLDSSFPSTMKKLSLASFASAMKKRGSESAPHGILVNLELLHCLCRDYVKFILMRNKAELSLEVKEILEDVALIPSASS